MNEHPIGDISVLSKALSQNSAHEGVALLLLWTSQATFASKTDTDELTFVDLAMRLYAKQFALLDADAARDYLAAIFDLTTATAAEERVESTQRHQDAVAKLRAAYEGTVKKLTGRLC